MGSTTTTGQTYTIHIGELAVDITYDPDEQTDRLAGNRFENAGCESQTR